MADVINLRLARKARDRSDKQRQAEANRARHGASKAERTRVTAEAERAARLLDGKRRDPAD
ncbi:DUF4169 family protein [Novosphingobium ginsenosidimutans]|uniref:DUF4169 family protein n=1 Tax=Novosphingobium ginsenosidimutans TaxID=1176536 RepID=A0A5B8RYP5_9SPHN|nr:DUF4169 family protein [Novosphingobium ginsenosidimutans]QEA14689.1 DUF4169 family protein [Novosphingobium ginsenosidimutans]